MLDVLDNLSYYPGMPFQKGNQHGKHANHKNNFCKEKFTGTKWLQKEGETLRVQEGEIDKYMNLGWRPGRPPASDETRKKQSEAGKRSNNSGHWQPGHRAWNFGDKMPDSAGVAMSAARLEKYGIIEAQIIEAREKNMSWCSHHQQFEPNTAFRMNKNGRRASRCNQCHNKHTPWYKRQFTLQRGLCAICGEMEQRLEAMNVDHDHNCSNPKHIRKQDSMIGCECTRGLLCSLCNPRLGYFEGFLDTMKSPEFNGESWEKKAFEYLMLYKSKTRSLKWTTVDRLSKSKKNLHSESRKSAWSKLIQDVS